MGKRSYIRFRLSSSTAPSPLHLVSMSEVWGVGASQPCLRYVQIENRELEEISSKDMKKLQTIVVQNKGSGIERKSIASIRRTVD